MGRTSRRAAWGWAGLAAAALFVAVTAVYRSGVLRSLDTSISHGFSAYPSAALEALGDLDDTIFHAGPAYAIAIALAVVLWRVGPRGSWLAPLLITASSFADLVVRRGFVVILHPRELLVAAQELLGTHYHGLSPYPSGHVERAMFLAVVALAYLPRWLSIPFAILAASTLVGRVYNGGHHVSEVVGGAALGISVGALAVWLVGELPTLQRLLSLDRRRQAERS